VGGGEEKLETPASAKSIVVDTTTRVCGCRGNCRNSEKRPYGVTLLYRPPTVLSPTTVGRPADRSPQRRREFVSVGFRVRHRRPEHPRRRSNGAFRFRVFPGTPVGRKRNKTRFKQKRRNSVIRIRASRVLARNRREPEKTCT